MDISTIKTKKPWWLPKGIWNKLVNAACDTTKDNLKIGVISGFVAEKSMEGLEKKISGKDDKTVEMVCQTLENGGQVFVKAAAACKDKQITEDEKSDVGTALGTTVEALLSQETVDAKIEEIREKLLYK